VRAIQIQRFGGVEVLEQAEIPEPQLRETDVLIRTRAAAVNPVDTYIRDGKYGPRPFPHVLGLAGAGEVVATGAHVTGAFAPGERVYYMNPEAGGYAELVRCPAARVYALPQKVSFEAGASIGVAGATAWRALFTRGEAKTGETVLVHGATGAVGTAAVQIAHAAGMKVIATGGTDAGRAAAKEFGADLVLDHHQLGYLQAARDFTAGHGVDVVLEMLANVNLDRDLGILAPRGRVVVIGSRGRIEIDPRQTMAKDSDIRGMALLNASESELRQLHHALYSALQHETYRPVVAASFCFAEAAEAHRRVIESHTPGGLVLVP
jgi:NADPH2:quinone reductase